MWVTVCGLPRALGLSLGRTLDDVAGDGELLGVGFSDFGFAWVVLVDGWDKLLVILLVDGFLSKCGVNGVTTSLLRGSPGVAWGSGLLGRISTTASELSRGFSLIMAIGEVGFSPVKLTKLNKKLDQHR